MKVTRTSSNRFRKLLAATAAAALMAVATVAAQSGFFQEQYEGELFGLLNEFETPGYSAGVVYFNGTLYIVDSDNSSLVAYDDGSTVARTIQLDVPDLMPNQIATASVEVVSGVGTVNKTVLLVSDSNTDRVLAFDLDGTFQFAMRLQWPNASYREGGVPTINGMAMGPQGKFRLTETEDGQTLEVVGAFAAGWAVDFGQGVPGVLLVYKDSPLAFDADSEEFVGTPFRTLTDGGRTNEAFGVAFDAQGNLYLVDSFRYTITAYNAAFDEQPLFTFGTPTIGGKTEEFYEPYGVSYWPDPSDSAGGRLFIADAINNRIVAYRPHLSGPQPTIVPLFAIDLPSEIEGDPVFPYGIAVDPVSGKVATTDASGYELKNRVPVLQTRNLVAYNLHLLDSSGTRVDSICSGADYSVRFSLTVPRGRPSVAGATPSLTVDGQTIAGTNDGPVDLDPLETQTYTYSLTAPGTSLLPEVVTLPMHADATASQTSDVLPRDGVVPVVDCSGLPPTIAVSPSTPKQVSGWTPVYPPVPYTLGLTVTADNGQGITETEYRFSGSYNSGAGAINVPNPGNGSPQLLSVTMPEMGMSSLHYRARSTKGIWSEWLEYPVWLVRIQNQRSNVGETREFTPGGAHQSGFTYAAADLPPGISFNPATGAFSGAPLAAGTYTVNMTETEIATGEVSTWWFAWQVDNLGPVSRDDAYALEEDGVLEVNAALGVLTNDTDSNGDPLTAVLVDSTTHGSLTLNPDGSFTYAPGQNFTGTDWFRYAASDGTVSSVNLSGVTITVNPVNDPPSFTAGAAPTVLEDAGAQTHTAWAANLSAGPADESSQTLTFLVATDNTALFSAVPAISANGTLTYQPAANASGVATVTVRLQDNGGGTNTSAPQTFTITVTAVNDAPSFVKGADQTVNENAAAQNVANWATAINAGPGEASQLVNFIVSNSNPALFSSQPAIASNGTLTYQLAANVFGTATVTVAVHDNGGTANGGVDTSAAQTFTITVNDVNDPPTFTAGPAQTVLEDAALQTVTAWATAISAGSASESSQTLAFVASTNNNALFSVLPSVSADGTLTYQPAANASGVATVTLQLQDSGGGTNTSAPQTFTITVSPVNDTPSFTKGTNPTVSEDAGAQTIAGWASAISAGPNEASQAVTFILSNSNPALFSSQPAIASNGTLTYQPAANAFGTAIVTVVARDNGGTSNGGVDTSEPQTFTITVNGVNDAPVAGNDSVTSSGAAPIEIAVLANDADLDGGILSLSTFTQPATGGTVTSSGNQLVFTPTPGFTGTVVFTYTVIDGQGGSATASVTVTVSGAVCNATATALVRRYTTVSSGAHIDGSIQVMTASNVTFNGGTLVGDLLMLGMPGINGTGFYAGLTYGTGASVPTNHVVTVNSGATLGNIVRRTDAVALPTVAAPPASTGNRDVTLNNPTDPTGSFATIRDLNLNSNVGPIAVPAGTYRSFTANTNTSFVIGVAGATTPSVYNFESLTLNSGSSLQVLGPVTVTVKNSVAFNGPAGAPAHPEWLTLRIAASGGLTLNNGSSLYGYAEVPNGSVTINDGTQLVGGLAADTLTLNSNGRLILRSTCQPNRAPTAAASSRTDVNGSVVSVQIEGNDEDGEALTYTASGLPPGVSMSPSGLISGTLTTSGVYTVTVTVTDSTGATGTATFTWTVVTPNRAPTASASDRSDNIGSAVSVQIAGADEDGDTLTYTATGLPSGVSISPSGLISGTLTTAGVYSVIVTVTDPSGATATATFTWTVVQPNRAPTASASNRTDNIGSAASVQMTGSDADGDVLTYTATGLPAGVSISPSGLVTGVLMTAGVYPVTVTVTDPAGATGVAAFTWTVIQPNRAPTVAASSRSDLRGSAVSVQISGADLDGGALTYTASGLPPGVSISSSGLISGTLTVSGVYTVTITVTDSAGATGTAAFTWTVVTPNQQPVVVNDNLSSIGAAPVTIPVLANDSDPDGGTLSIFSYTQPTGGNVSASGNQLVFTPAPGFVGTATFTYVVSDGQGGMTTGTVTVVISAAPTCSLSGYLTYSQGGWGNNGAPGQFLAAYFATVYPAGHVTIGGTKTLKFTSASAIKNFLPQGGSPNVLTSSLVNPTSSPAGNLAAQLLALRLAVDFSAAGITKRGLGQLEMVSGPFAGQTVDQILAVANSAIGGGALPSGMTLSTLNGILDSLNLNFHEGTDNDGLLRCAAGAVTCSAVTLATTGSGSTLYGAAGNIRSFSSNGVDVNVSGFARAKSNGAWSAAYLGAWSVGMGVTDGSEGNGTGDAHKLDNVGDRVNYMLFEFSQPVVVTKAYLAYLGVSSNATVWIGTKTNPYGSHLTLSDALLASLGTPEDSTGSGSQAQWRPFNAGSSSGNVLVIAAKPSGSGDAFKIAQLEFRPCGGPVNSPPTVSAANRSDNKGVAVSVQLSGNDPEGGALTYSATGLPAGLSINSTGKITGTPTTAGTYTVTLTVTDAGNATGTDTFEWTVVQPNRAPDAVADSLATNPTKTVTLNVLANDTDLDGDTLTIASVTQPSKGSVSIQSGAIKYVAPASGTGTTTFTYTVNDGRGGTDTGTVTVTLTNPPQLPLAVDDTASVKKKKEKVITVLGNDSVFGLAATVAIVGQPSKGEVKVNSNGTITYTAPSSTGTVTFTYRVTTASGSDLGSVKVTITS